MVALKLQHKLTVAFITVTAISTLVIMLFSNIYIKQIFGDYVVQYRTARLEQWANFFLNYYQQQGGWDGLETFFSREEHLRARGRRLAPGDYLILADREGRVVLGTNDDLGGVLSKTTLAGGFPLSWEEERVGTLFLNPVRPLGAETLEEEFYQSVTRAVLTGGGIVFLLALGLSFYFSERISSPVYRLISGARAFAGGDYKYRVNIQGDDEFGQLGKAFNHMAENVERNQGLRRDLLADVAHELRTPLAILRGNLESVQAGVVQPDLEVISSLQDEVLRMAGLVNDLQELNLAEAGRLKLDLSLVNLPELLQRAAQVLGPEAAGKQVVLKVQAEKDIPDIEIDPGKVNQVLVNLLHNALRYTPAGGTVTLGLSRGEGGVEVSVSDTGPGIKEEDLPYIFERFYRSSRDRTRKDGGAGLGLAIARGFVEAHGGNLGAENNREGGSTFTFSLPGALIN